MFEYTQELSEKLLTAIASVEIKEQSETYKMVITDEIRDRDGEIIMVDGISIKNYMKNPVVLLDHDYEVENIVGKTKRITQEGKKLIAEFVFADTPNWQLAKQLYDGGFLKASSIWFRGKRDTNDFTKFIEIELLEWSLVAVPCNPNALSQDRKELYQEAINKWLIKEETEKVETTQLDNIESMLKILLDGKSKSDTVVEEIAELEAKRDELIEEVKEWEAKKSLIQTINNSFSTALQHIKLLKN